MSLRRDRCTIFRAAIIATRRSRSATVWQGFARAIMAVMSDSKDASIPLVMERIGKVSESNRRFDLEFWQRQGSSAIFAAAWEMVVEAYRLKGKSESDLL
jgi:hypothetical protein